MISAGTSTAGWLTISGPLAIHAGSSRVSPGMKAATVPLVLAALAGIAGCSARSDAKATPAVSSAPAPSPTVLSAADRAAAQLTCFSWTTYDKAQKGGQVDLDKYAVIAQQAAANMEDPRWSETSRMTPAEAMRTLGDLCRGIRYREP